MVSRREFLEMVSAAGALTAINSCAPTQRAGSRVSGSGLDRASIIRRHNPHITSIDPRAVLSVGNGNFAFNVDCTGLQSLPTAYNVIPLCTMSHWGWHSKPGPAGVDPAALRLKQHAFHGRTIGYPTDQTGQQATFNYMRENPHWLHLGRIGLLLDGNELRSDLISDIDQTLDLYTGIITSKFKLAGLLVEVTAQWAYEHPAMLGALGALPGLGIDPVTMAATVQKVRDVWDFSRGWGWDFPLAAMAAARTGQPHLAIDFLMMDSPRNAYLPNGCNYQRDGLPAYFPCNGGLLAAIALMVAGWQDGPTKPRGLLPGFPRDGKWDVRAEGFMPIL